MAVANNASDFTYAAFSSSRIPSAYLRIGHSTLRRRQRFDRTLHALDGGGQQRFRLHVRRILLLTDSVRLSLIILHLTNLSVQALDISVELIDSRLLGLDLGRQDLNLLSELLDGVLLV